MPLTPSHPAAIAILWPLVRSGQLPLSALAIGAMSPDFEYLWRLRIESKWSHTPLGILYFCLPVGLLSLVVWVGIVRGPVRRLLAMAPRPLSLSGAWWTRAAPAVLLGAATHVIWDGFTHGFPWATRLVPMLRQQIAVVGVAMPVFNLLQHLSTVLGGAVVLWWLVTELRSGDPRRLMEPWRIATFGVVGVVMLALGLWNALRWGTPSDYGQLEIWLGRGAVGGLGGLAIALVAFSLGHRLVIRGSGSAKLPN